MKKKMLMLKEKFLKLFFVKGKKKFEKEIKTVGIVQSDPLRDLEIEIMENAKSDLLMLWDQVCVNKYFSALERVEGADKIINYHNKKMEKFFKVEG